MDNSYKQIADYGIIGNCRSCALVSNTGSIDWACLPNFDSPAYFLKILDTQKGGFFKVSPTGFFQADQRYLKATNILETYFFNSKGSISLQDFMPLSKEEENSDQISEFGTKIVRLIKAVKGNHEINIKLKITPNFATEKTKIFEEDNQVIFEDSEYKFILQKKHHQFEINQGIVTVKFNLKEGEQEFISLEFFRKNDEIKKLSKADLNTKLADYYFKTLEFWQWWSSLCTYKGAYQTQVLRSALTLKLLTFTPTGAIVAAPTTSLPEKIGGNLNWDYRYTWLRDASFTVYAFLGLGYLKEAQRFINWLESVCLREGSTIKIMYGIHGEEELVEKKLGHLNGFLDSRPVRIGNGAASQKQFDIFGEVLSAISLYVNAGGRVSEGVKQFIKILVDYCCIHWKEKDAGIWEVRHGDKHNTYSKLMCWVGVDRGIRIAKQLRIKDIDLIVWEQTRAEIKKDILEKGFNKKLNAFTAYYNSDVLDTSTLNIPIVGFLPPDDPRVLSTIDNIMQKLVIDWFVLRTSDTENKLQEGEGTFFLSTFWLIDCLSLLGKTREAKIWLEKILHDSTPLGLYAEEYEPIRKIHLGNFPQAFTHLGLINSCLNLKQAEVFGSEQLPTIQAERLAKVIKSVLNAKIDVNLGGKTLKQLLKIINPRN